jgi:hypothetical protein
MATPIAGTLINVPACMQRRVTGGRLAFAGRAAWLASPSRPGQQPPSPPLVHQPPQSSASTTATDDGFRPRLRSTRPRPKPYSICGPPQGLARPGRTPRKCNCRMIRRRRTKTGIRISAVDRGLGIAIAIRRPMTRWRKREEASLLRTAMLATARNGLRAVLVWRLRSYGQKVSD